MQVIKRDGRREDVSFDKITARIKKLCYGLADYVEPVHISQKVIQGLFNGVTTTELDNLAAETAATMAPVHPDYALLAARISVSNLHKNTNKNFCETMQSLHDYIDPKTGEKAGLISSETLKIAKDNCDRLNAAIIYDRDFEFDFFGFKTLERSYLLRMNGEVVERPQQMLMRVAIGIHGEDIDSAIETYELMSQKWFIHATPTLFNAGTPKPQLSSCFLLSMTEDSIPGIFETLTRCAKISQSAGGIGLSVHNVRATGSYIKGTGGTSNGLVPMLQVYNDTARYVDQGGGKRKGAFAVYLEPWHADIFEFLDLKKNHGKEEMRARDLFYSMWIPDLFMQRVKDGGDWTLFDPGEAKGLFDVHSGEFEALYHKYEAEGRGRKTVKAQDVWFAILESQIETGTPYILYKDACNRKSNQQNLGTIRSSNLCTEIIEYTSPDEVAVCNLGSISLPKFVDEETHQFDYDKLHEITRVLTRNLNRVIDVNYYPIPEARNSNMRHRPVGIGVQGLADAFILMGLAFDSDEARKVNRDIFETIYHGALTQSVAEAKEAGAYESFPGSPASKGVLQYDMWGVQPSGRWDFDGLKSEIKEHGLRNSLLVAPMPTASTSQILGNNECFEPYSSNMYTRRTLSGEFVIVNKHLLKDLHRLGLWDETMKQRLMAANGSVQHIEEIPEPLRARYKTVYEISQRVIIDMAADRGAFICQSQSMNLFVEDPNFGKLSSMHFHAWKSGLKTGMYYLRSKAAVDPIKFTLNKEHQRVRHGNEKEGAFAKTQLPTHAAKAPTVPASAVAKTATAQAAAAIPTTEVKEKPAAPAPAGKKRNTFGKKRNTFGKKPAEATVAEAPAVTTITADQLDGQACRLDDPDCLSCGA